MTARRLRCQAYLIFQIGCATGLGHRVRRAGLRYTRLPWNKQNLLPNLRLTTWSADEPSEGNWSMFRLQVLAVIKATERPALAVSVPG
jgi:hypothetical protein